MDMKTEKWFAQLTVSGTSSINESQGSLIHICTWLAKTLMTIRVKDRPTSGRQIQLTIADSPISSSPDQSLADELTVQLNQDIHELSTAPLPTETMADYLTRLTSYGLTPDAARLIANEWFPEDARQLDDSTASLRNWLSDHKVKRLLDLTYSQTLFDSALPSEYTTLRKYAQQTYPKESLGVTFRNC